jgi:hypothetical protein
MEHLIEHNQHGTGNWEIIAAFKQESDRDLFLDLLHETYPDAQWRVATKTA